MSFASGFVTGLAKTVDDQLKNDMLRTQKRMDGMEQYRVTRRRADEDRVKKERREVGDVMKQLATFVGGDMYKAKVLFETGGGTVAGATKFYDKLDNNKSSLGENFKIEDIVTGINKVERPDGVSDADFIDNYIEGYKKITSEMTASGLYGKIFNPDISAQVDKNVDSLATIPNNIYNTIKTKPLTINHEALIERQAYKKANQIAPKGTFMAEYLSLDRQFYNEGDETKKKAIGKRRDDMYAKYLKDKELTKSYTGKDTTIFSKENITSVINNSKENALEQGGYTKNIDGVITTIMEGNAGGVFLAQMQGLKAIEDRFKTSMNSEPILRDAIKAEKVLQKNARNTYTGNIQNESMASDKALADYNALPEDTNGNKIGNDNKIVAKPKEYELYKKENVAKSIIDNIPQAQLKDKTDTEKALIVRKALNVEGKRQRWARNSVIEVRPSPNSPIIRGIWTGNEVIF